MWLERPGVFQLLRSAIGLVKGKLLKQEVLRIQLRASIFWTVSMSFEDSYIAINDYYYQKFILLI